MEEYFLNAQTLNTNAHTAWLDTHTHTHKFWLTKKKCLGWPLITGFQTLQIDLLDKRSETSNVNIVLLFHTVAPNGFWKEATAEEIVPQPKHIKRCYTKNNTSHPILAATIIERSNNVVIRLMVLITVGICSFFPTHSILETGWNFTRLHRSRQERASLSLH